MANLNAIIAKSLSIYDAIIIQCFHNLLIRENYKNVNYYYIKLNDYRNKIWKYRSYLGRYRKNLFKKSTPSFY